MGLVMKDLHLFCCEDKVHSAGAETDFLGSLIHPVPWSICPLIVEIAQNRVSTYMLLDSFVSIHCFHNFIVHNSFFACA